VAAPLVIGVRHHSPACARLVGETIERVRPRFVLVEGPSDMNERMEELCLAHQLPIALFTWRQAEGGSRGTWTPFCAYSPEWVAIQAARRVGATALFIDLPAWHEAFAGEENRYSDRHVRASDRIDEICARLGFEGIDALWDHLFEGADAEGLAARLGRYFDEVRADEPAGARDEPRERFMAQWIAWAMAERAGEVVVVCGGYHKPALERGWREAPAERPALAPPAEARVGSYLVPFSFKRLDSFAGYASGMPSPAFYQAVWDDGPARAAEEMLGAAVLHLRARQQRVSVADAIVARTLADGLGALRGHPALLRVDVLDGLAGALVKDALDAPLPWTRRGLLLPRTDPLLVELVAAFSGDRVGNLAPETPRPPLVDDAFAELARVGVALGREEARVKVDLTAPAGMARSHVLHRLRVLGIPGFTRSRGPSFARQHTALSEEWVVVRRLETDTALIEAAIHGATLEAAAAAKLEDATRLDPRLSSLAQALIDAALAGITTLTARWLEAIAALVAAEPSFAELGGALARLHALHRGEALPSGSARADLAAVLEACFERGLWLFEGVQGESAPLDEALVRAVVALRDVVRQAPFAVDGARVRGLCARRMAAADAPACIRGAAVGFDWSLEPGSDAEARALAALRGSARPERMGDFLAGLFALAREQVIRARALLAAIDAVVSELERSDFFVALPALRQAFAYFPPRERLAIAEQLVAPGEVDPMQLVATPIEPEVVMRGAELDRRAAALAARYGLADEGEPP
jgi:hypothetical protein